MESTPPATNPLVCNLAAMSAAQRARHEQVIEDLFQQSVEEIKELPDGFAFRAAGANFLEAAEFVSLERLCCTFFDFTLSFDAASTTFWLSIRGPEGVKEFLREGFAQAGASAPHATAAAAAGTATLAG